MLLDHKTTWPSVRVGRFAEFNTATNQLRSGTGRRTRSGPETLIVQNLCGWEGHDANLWRQIDPQVFGLDGFAKALAPPTLPAKVPANIKNINLLRGAYLRF